MQFIDLAQQQQRIRLKINQAIQNVLRHGQYIMGPEIDELETQLAQLTQTTHCIATSSGTTALQIALMALGIGPGDEVITTPFSFCATTETILLLGAKPVYVDIEPDTLNIDPHKIANTITDCTKAILPVSLYGQTAELDKINVIAAQHRIPVIEDGAQSLGATHHGKPSCGLTTIACTSFFPSKPLGAYGDAGACFTNDDTLANTMRSIVNHGQEERYHHVRLGINGRCDTLQAAILLAKLTVFEDELNKRQHVADWYKHYLQDQVVTPSIKPYNFSSFAQYTIQTGHCTAIAAHLKAHHIPTAVHYPLGLHQQPINEQILGSNYYGHFPITEKAAKSVLSLPFHPYLQENQVAQIAKQVIAATHAMAQAMTVAS